jgi:hypothetical protein
MYYSNNGCRFRYVVLVLTVTHIRSSGFEKQNLINKKKIK